jgi:hypothetical protein
MKSLNIKQQIILVLLYGISIFLMLVVPVSKMIEKVIVGQEPQAKWSFIWAFIVAGVGFGLFKILKKRYNRRLQSIDVADELGVNGSTPILLRRSLLLLEVAIPLTVISLFLYGLKLIETVDFPSHKLFLEFQLWFIGGLAIMLIHDYLKAHFRRVQAINNHIKFEKKVEKKKQKISSTQGGVVR